LASVAADYPFGYGAEAPARLELMRQSAVERDSERIISLICEQAARLTGADYAGVRLINKNNWIEWRGMWGNLTDAWLSARQSTYRGAATEAVIAGRTVVSRTDELRANGAWIALPNSVRASEGGVVQVSAPLAYSGRAIGALVLGWRSDITPSEEQLRVAEVLAGYGAIVLDNARSREESERRRAEAEALAELARRGAAAQAMDAVVDLVCRTACQIIGCDFAAVLFKRPAGVAWLGVSGNRSNIWYGQHIPSGRGPAATSMAEARTVVFSHDGEADGRLEGLQVLAAEDTHTALAVPLLQREGPFGSLLAGWRQPEEVTSEQRRLAEALGGYAAAILDNALSRFESERRRSEAEALAELVRLGAAERDPRLAT